MAEHIVLVLAYDNNRGGEAIVTINLRIQQRCMAVIGGVWLSMTICTLRLVIIRALNTALPIIYNALTPAPKVT